MNFKKVIAIVFAAFVMAGVLSACTKKSEIKNEIAYKELTQDQQDIVDLLSSETQEILLFDYKTEDTYKSLTIWVEVYESGELLDRSAYIDSYSDSANAFNGQLAVLIDYGSDIRWTLTINSSGTTISHTGEAANAPDGLARAYGAIDTPVEIEPGKDIVLYTSIYSAGSILFYSDMQQYVDEPDSLANYPYVQIIKCRFE